MKDYELITGNLTDIGLNPHRETNQDYYGMYSGDWGNLWVVCDGMGGHAGGEEASRLAVESVKHSFENSAPESDSERTDLIEASIDAAQKAVIDHSKANPQLLGMGTTLVMLYTAENKFWFANVGDSRIYLKRGKKVVQLSRDHSKVQQMLDEGILSPEQAADYPKNQITRAIGADDYQPDITGPLELEPGDVFLLCTDGMHQYLESEVELQLLLQSEPQEACENMVRLAKERGGSDNITVQVIRVAGKSHGKSFLPSIGVPVHKEKKALPKLNLRYIAIAMVGIALVFIIILLVGRGGKKPAEQSVVELQETVPEETIPEATEDFDKLKTDLDASLPAAGFKSYGTLLAEICRAAELDSQELLIFNQDISEVPGHKRVVYMMPGKGLLLLHPYMIDNLFQIRSEAIYYLVSLAGSLLQEGMLTGHTGWESDEKIPISAEQIAEARRLLAIYNSSTGDPILNTGDFDRISRYMDGRVFLSGKSIVLE